MIPHNRTTLTDKDGRPTRDWYDWFRRLGEVFEPLGGATGLLATKQDKLVSTGNIKTVNGNSLLGSGDLTVSGGGLSAGSSFPGSPSSGDLFFRSDLGWLCFYDGTRWLTAHEYIDPIANGSVVIISSAGPVASGYLSPVKSYQPYVTNLIVSARVNSTNNATNYWSANFLYYDAGGTKVTIKAFDTKALTANTYSDVVQAINSPLSTSAFLISLEWTRVSSPGALTVAASMQYRLIVT